MVAMTSEAADPGLITSIAEATPDGGLRYRGVDIADLIGVVRYEHVWGLLVHDDLGTVLPPAEPFSLPHHTGDVRVDVQSVLAQLAPVWGFRPLLDISPDEAAAQLTRAAVMTLSFIAQSARNAELPSIPQREVDRAGTAAGRLLMRWQGEVDPKRETALDAYLVASAEHGLASSTTTARIIASTGADVAACLSGAVGAISGPLHGGAPSRVYAMLEAADRFGDPTTYLRQLIDTGQRVMGFGHRIYRTVDPRARQLRDVCRRLGAPRYELAATVENAALDLLRERHPDRVIATNIEFWAAVILDMVGIPPALFVSFFAGSRVAGWSAHILEQQAQGRIVRPTARYVGPPPRSLSQVAGYTTLGIS